MKVFLLSLALGLSADSPHGLCAEPLHFIQHIQDCTPTYPSSSINKFADDATMMGTRRAICGVLETTWSWTPPRRRSWLTRKKKNRRKKKVIQSPLISWDGESSLQFLGIHIEFYVNYCKADEWISLYMYMTMKISKHILHLPHITFNTFSTFHSTYVQHDSMSSEQQAWKRLLYKVNKLWNFQDIFYTLNNYCTFSTYHCISIVWQWAHWLRDLE